MLIRQITLEKLRAAVELHNRRHVVVTVLYSEIGKAIELAAQLDWRLVSAWHQPNLPIAKDIPHTCLLLRSDPP